MATSNKGNVAVRDAWQSGKRTRAETDSTVLVKQGLYADLAAIQPAKGVELVTGFVVESSTLEPRKGLLGTLTINLVEKDVSSGTKPVGALKSTIEIDMAQLEKPILTKSDYSGYADVIELWKAGPAALRSQYKYKDASETEQTLTGNALIVAQLALKGIDTYLAFNPVITRMSTYKSRPTPENYGKICAPPVTAPGTWVYLKTSDRIVQQSDGKYVRTEQWTGADEWAPELYESA
ncbi:MAG: hypothetical protein PHW08_00595 [Kiritimatiellae bacterium]|nr:hypothetical protein [Kiritimatiellia bacterium]